MGISLKLGLVLALPPGLCFLLCAEPVDVTLKPTSHRAGSLIMPSWPMGSLATGHFGGKTQHT